MFWITVMMMKNPSTMPMANPLCLMIAHGLSKADHGLTDYTGCLLLLVVSKIRHRATGLLASVVQCTGLAVQSQEVKLADMISEEANQKTPEDISNRLVADIEKAFAPCKGFFIFTFILSAFSYDNRGDL